MKMYGKKSTGPYAWAAADIREEALGRKRVASWLGFLVMAMLLWTVSVFALDFTDLDSLVQSGVPEDVIISMWNERGAGNISESEANILRQRGASENLIVTIGVRPDAAPAAAPTVTVREGTTAVTSTSPAQGSPIMPLDVTMSTAAPALGPKEGWLSIANRDWQAYFILVNYRDHRLTISRHPNGGVVVNPGENVILNLPKHTYKMYGDTGEKLEVKIRECLTTTLSLEPFGVVGNSGLTGIANDRGKIRSEVLFSPYVPVRQVIVEPAPVVVVPPPPPPVRYYYDRPYGYRYYYGW